MKRIVAVIAFFACAAALVGCETTKGAGKDIENTGENIQHAVS